MALKASMRAKRSRSSISSGAESYVAGNARHQTINYFLEQPGNFKISQLVGSLFLHAGWMHLLGNMFFLWLFGNAVNAKLGHWQFLALYFLAGIFAGGIYLIFGPAIPVLGASGAIMGVMGAFFMLLPAKRCVLRLGAGAGVRGQKHILLLASGRLLSAGLMGHPKRRWGRCPCQPCRRIYVRGSRPGRPAVAWLGGVPSQ